MKKYQKLKFLKYSVFDAIDHNVPEKNLFLSMLRHDWTRIVGEGVAHHSLPVSVRNDTLTVNVDDPIWIQELTLQKDAMRESIVTYFNNKKYTEMFHTVRFKTGDITRVVIPEAPAEEPLMVDKETLKSIDEKVAKIEDKELRLALRKYLIASSLRPVKEKISPQKPGFDNF